MFEPSKIIQLQKANAILKLDNISNNKIVFVYSAPKVGSTSIVTSLRLFCANSISIIHIHDEEMLKVLGHIDGITVNEIILYNKFLNKDVYVIDVYRSPIERKISTFFEKIANFHFNNTDEAVNKYNINRIITRFNNIFNHIATGDHFIDVYNIPIPDSFDFTNKYLLVEHNGIKYIKLRLVDSYNWNSIFKSILGINIVIVKDYETSNKTIKDIYKLFKETYKIPNNLLCNIIKCKYFNYYYTPNEKEQYYNYWRAKSTHDVVTYTDEQYALYNSITLENSHIDYIQLDHYLDDGCLCKACSLKRIELRNKILRGDTNNITKIVHEKAKNELIKQNNINTINAINLISLVRNNSRKNLTRDMKLINR